MDNIVTITFRTSPEGIVYTQTFWCLDPLCPSHTHTETAATFEEAANLMGAWVGAFMQRMQPAGAA